MEVAPRDGESNGGASIDARGDLLDDCPIERVDTDSLGAVNSLSGKTAQ